MATEKVERKALIFAVDATGYIPPEIVENTSRAYSVAVIGKAVQVGIPLEEQELVPDFIKQVGVGFNSPDFVERADEYWAEWKFDIPISKFEKGNAVNGLIIDGSYTKKDGKIWPVDIQEYIAFNLLMKDSSVGKSEEDYIESKDQYDFFIIDLSEKEKAETAKAQSSIQITIKLGELFQKENSVDLIKQILISSKKYNYYDIAQLGTTGLQTEIYSFAEKNPDIFSALFASKDLETRSLVMEMISLDVLTKVGDYYYDGQNKIGEMKECMLYMKDESKKVEVEKLKETLKEVKLRNVISQ